MGKGDIKSRRGKIINKSFGVRRPKNSSTITARQTEVEPVALKVEAVKPTKPVKPRATKKKTE